MSNIIFGTNAPRQAILTFNESEITMGAHPYGYFVPYETDIAAALQKLRDREFKAGRYNPIVSFLSFPETDLTQSPGPKHPTIEAAMEAAKDSGTRSILDISRIGTGPAFFTASPLPDQTLDGLYDTRFPTRAQVEENMDFLENIERGHAVYVTIYKDNTPSEIYFAGYSFD